MKNFKNNKRTVWQTGSMSLEVILFLSGAAICAATALPVLFEHLRMEMGAYSEMDVMEMKNR